MDPVSPGNSQASFRFVDIEPLKRDPAAVVPTAVVPPSMSDLGRKKESSVITESRRSRRYRRQRRIASPIAAMPRTEVTTPAMIWSF